MPGPLAGLAPSARDRLEQAARSGSPRRRRRPAPARGAGRPARSSSSTPFARALRSVSSIAARSASTPSTGSKPSFAAAIASTPEPQPRSQNAELAASAEAGRQAPAARVWPRASARGTCASSDACPCRTRRPGRSRPPRRRRAAPARSHGGRTYSRPRDQHREVEALPALVPVVGNLLGCRPRRARRRAAASNTPRSGSSPGAP